MGETMEDKYASCTHDDSGWCTDACPKPERVRLRERVAELEANAAWLTKGLDGLGKHWAAQVATFAELIRADERERIAKDVAESFGCCSCDYAPDCDCPTGDKVASFIRGPGTP